MKTKTINLYSFEELSEKAQQKAIENLADINTEYAYWYESEIENLSCELSEKGFKNVEICFSGFSSQGDGASFDAEINLSDFTTDKRIIAVAEAYCDFRIDKRSSANHYSHERTRYVDYNALDEKYVRINETIKNLSEEIEQIRLSESKRIYRALEKEYEYLTSKDAIIETIEANEYLFFADGKLIPSDMYPVKEVAKPSLFEKVITWLKSHTLRDMAVNVGLWAFAVLTLAWNIYSQTLTNK